MWFNAKKLTKTLTNPLTLILLCNMGSQAQKWPKIAQNGSLNRAPIIGPGSCLPLLLPLLFWSRWHDQQCSSIFTLEKVFIFFSTSVAWVAFRSKGLNWGVGVGVGGVIFLGGLQINVATMSGTPHLLSKLNLGVAEHFFNLLRF